MDNAYTDPELSDEIRDIFGAWRTKALNVMLIVVVILGLPALISSLSNAIERVESHTLVWGYPIVYTIVVIFTIFHRIGPRVRGWGLLLLAYTNAAISLTRLGMAGSGRIYLFWAPIAGVVLVGSRTGFIATAISLVIYAAFAMLAHLGILETWLEVVDNPVTLDYWIEAGTAFAMLLAPIAVLLEHFYTFQKRTLASERLASAELVTANARLENYSRTLEAANERLKALDRMKDDFIANVSHELRTPVTSLKVYHSLLKERPDKRDVYLDTLQRETDRLENIITNLLDLSVIGHEEMVIDLSPVDVNTLAAMYVTDCEELAEGRGLTLTIEKASNLPSVRANQVLLGRVMSTFLSNAFNYTPSGGSVKVLTRLRQEDGKIWVGLAVADTGFGVSVEEQSRLFERFFRGARAREAHTPGIGLGLAIAKQIVDCHHGEIGIDSEGIPGKGTTFTMWLPVEQEETTEAIQRPDYIDTHKES